MPASHPLLASWDASKQQQYRAKHHEQVLTFHFVLDASPSMIGQDATNLRKAYNMYLAYLQHHAHPMSLAEVRCFSTDLSPSHLQPLGLLQPLTVQTYDPRKGDGTALYRAIGETCTTAPGDGQHVLVVFTDGADNASEDFGWTSTRVGALLQTLQDEQAWLAVFLGAFPEAVPVARLMQFKAGNCLVFSTDKIPEAFQALRQATQTYLAAAPQARKLLAAGGIF
jgi:hypothetical protein